MSIRALSNVVGSFYHKVVTSDALHLGHVETFPTPAYAAVRFALQAANGRVREEFLREGFQVSHLAFMDYPMTLLSGDLLLIDAVPYLVQGPQRDMGGRAKAYSVPLLKKDQ